MWNGLIKCGLLCFCMAAQPWTTHASQATAQTYEPGLVYNLTGFRAVAPVILADASSPSSQPAEPDLPNGPTESRTQHAVRINGDIAVITSSILAVFVLLRILLLWQRTHNRKKLIQVNINPPGTKA
jgi:hypothetical protein